MNDLESKREQIMYNGGKIKLETLVYTYTSHTVLTLTFYDFFFKIFDILSFQLTCFVVAHILAALYVRHANIQTAAGHLRVNIYCKSYTDL